MAGIRVVTDSACDLPPDLEAELGIEIVPLTIRFGNEELVDRRDLSPQEFWSRMASSPVLPETAAPSEVSVKSWPAAIVAPSRSGMQVSGIVSSQPMTSPR